MADQSVTLTTLLHKKCSIHGCEYKHYAKGFCQPHYNRNLKYGDPLAGATPWGAVKTWLRDVAVPYTGDDCLIFPFSRANGGYAVVRVGGRTRAAHAVVLEAVDGLPRGDGRECRHLCGNGHLGCVNPKHLKWGTHAENMADMIIHGTNRSAPRYDEDHHDFRATDGVVAKILNDLNSGMTQKEAARKYGFAQSHISRIKNGWRRSKYDSGVHPNSRE